MYKGNIKDFIDELSLHLKKEYNVRLDVQKWKDPFKKRGVESLLFFRHDGLGGYLSPDIPDIEEFEEWVIDWVRQKLIEHNYIK
jgi:hypothetical protein